MSLPLVKDVIAVRDKKSGLQPSTENATSSSWSRAEVIKQLSDRCVQMDYSFVQICKVYTFGDKRANFDFDFHSVGGGGCEWLHMCVVVTVRYIVQ